MKSDRRAKDAGYFNAAPPEAKDIVSFIPSTLDRENRTVDVVWYGGQTVPRLDLESGDMYMLRFDMAGCRMDRLNAGAPVFDNHMSGADFKSAMANQLGTRAQRGVVLRAWADGAKGMATLKFYEPDEDDDSEDAQYANQLFDKIDKGIVRNLSFGTWIYSKKSVEATAGTTSNQFVADDWEPFEISPCPVAADFSTTFLSAANNAADRATSPLKETPVATTTNTGAGDGAREVQQLDAVRTEQLKREGMEAERKRVSDIRAAGAQMTKHGLTDAFINTLVQDGTSLEDARTKIFEELAVKGGQNAKGQATEIRTEVQMTRDGAQTRFQQMEAAMLLRYDPNFGLSRKQKHDGTSTDQFLKGFGEKRQEEMSDLAREYRGFSLLDMARESLEIAGRKTRGMSRNQIAEEALVYAKAPRMIETFDAAGQGTSDFPSVLANVANKTARQGYEAYPQTFKPFSRPATASDFKAINRVQLSDAPALEKLNESGEFRRANLKDSNQPYSLGTYGKIVGLTRKTIINDDLQMFTRVPAIMGVSAARMESDVVWAVITGNQVMGEDGVVLFHASHSNLNTGANSALILGVGGATPTGLTQARSKLRLQKAPNGTPLNLTPRFMLLPTSQESVGLQLIYPIQLAATAVTGVVPQWVQSLVPIVEPRLDAASSTAWYMVSDNAVIDTLEYCYLEGQEGIYIETRQGFEVDGIEIKVREDFAAAAIDFRGMQKNNGA